jgi:DNA-binding transcriptional MocR family regulator
VGSLSKTSWGGLRIGWVRADVEMVQRLTAVAVRSTMAGPVMEQLAACALLDGFPEALAELRGQLRERRAVLIGELQTHLPAWHVPEPAGGLVLWCGLPSARSRALVAAAESHGVRLAAGPLFGTGHALDDRLRLPYTHPPELLRTAVRLLAQADADVERGSRTDGGERAPSDPVV